MRAREFLPAHALMDARNRLLERLCRNAAAHVPAYRKRLGSDGATADYCAERLARVPLLTRYELVNGREALLSEIAERSRLRFIKTGGSTGAPAQVAQDRCYRDWSQASTLLFNEWAGLSLGDPYFFLWGAARDVERQKRMTLERLNLGLLQVRRVLDASRLHRTVSLEHLAAINRYHDTRFLIGYANEIYNLASFSREQGIPVSHSMKTIVTTAENLTQAMREEIQEVFGCTVLNRYGSRDLGDIASECSHQRGLHINPLYTYVEVVDDDGRRLPYGEQGHLVMTNLHNHVMPLIRYVVGDTGILAPPTRCACGREWETIVQLTGRASEVVLLRHGGRTRAAALHGAFETLPYLRRYQIHQHGFDELTILLHAAVPNYVASHRALLDEAVTKLRSWTSPQMQVTFVETDRFERTPTGKELTVVQKFRPASGQVDAA